MRRRLLRGGRKSSVTWTTPRREETRFATNREPRLCYCWRREKRLRPATAIPAPTRSSEDGSGTDGGGGGGGGATIPANVNGVLSVFPWPAQLPVRLMSSQP